MFYLINEKHIKTAIGILFISSSEVKHMHLMID